MGPEVYKDLTETDLVAICRQGNLEAFNELIVRHQDTVFSLCYRLLGDYDEAADLSQEIFLNCFRKIALFRGESKFSTWLYRMAVNMAKNVYKHHERRAYSRTQSINNHSGTQQEDPQEFQVASPNPGPRELASGREEIRLLHRQLQNLPFEHRQVILFRYVEGLDYNEIGKILDVSIGTVKSRLSRARKQLRELMRDVLQTFEWSGKTRCPK